MKTLNVCASICIGTKMEENHLNGTSLPKLLKIHLNGTLTYMEQNQDFSCYSLKWNVPFKWIITVVFQILTLPEVRFIALVYYYCKVPNTASAHSGQLWLERRRVLRGLKNVGGNQNLIKLSQLESKVYQNYIGKSTKIDFPM